MKIDEKKTSMCVFIMNFIDDMFQQTNNDEFSRHNVDLNCRNCFCSRNELINLKFDIVEKNSYYKKIISQRNYVKQFVNKNQKRYFRNTNNHLKTLFIAKLCSTFDLIQIKIYDVFHSK